ncbi:MAG TPA: ATP-binding protein [Verrucomicrobiae bacterium]|nr:ATP-binding protein [Verrucomicrobiae bacterium]
MSRRPQPRRRRRATRKDRFETVFAANPMPMWICDAESLRLLAVNRAALALYGLTRARFLRRAVQEIMPPAETARWLDALKRLKPNGAPGLARWRLPRPDGSSFTADVSLSRLRFRNRPACLAVITDQTARNTTEEELRSATRTLEQRAIERTAELEAVNKALRAEMTRRSELENELLNVSEREQRRIGRDLHDGLCQITTATAMMCEALERDLRESSLPHFSRTARRITRLIQSVSDEARRLAHGLSPVGMDAEGLMDALANLARSTKRLFHVACHFECAEPVLIADHATAIHLFRIAQEAVNNAVRHAKPGRIRLRLQRSVDGLRLTVTDNGRWLPPKPRAGRGMGLHVMGYRAHKIGGTLRIEPRQNRGTTVLCHVPAAAAQPDAA